MLPPMAIMGMNPDKITLFKHKLNSKLEKNTNKYDFFKFLANYCPNNYDYELVEIRAILDKLIAGPNPPLIHKVLMNVIPKEFVNILKGSLKKVVKSKNFSESELQLLVTSISQCEKISDISIIKLLCNYKPDNFTGSMNYYYDHLELLISKFDEEVSPGDDGDDDDDDDEKMFDSFGSFDDDYYDFVTARNSSVKKPHIFFEELCSTNNTEEISTFLETKDFLPTAKSLCLIIKNPFLTWKEKNNIYDIFISRGFVPNLDCITADRDVSLEGKDVYRLYYRIMRKLLSDNPDDTFVNLLTIDQNFVLKLGRIIKSSNFSIKTSTFTAFLSKNSLTIHNDRNLSQELYNFYQNNVPTYKIELAEYLFDRINDIENDKKNSTFLIMFSCHHNYSTILDKLVSRGIKLNCDYVTSAFNCGFRPHTIRKLFENKIMVNWDFIQRFCDHNKDKISIENLVTYIMFLTGYGLIIDEKCLNRIIETFPSLNDYI
jgi:hypothetical protein